MTKEWHKYPNPERLSHGSCKWCGKDVKIIDEDDPNYHQRCLETKERCQEEYERNR